MGKDNNKPRNNNVWIPHELYKEILFRNFTKNEKRVLDIIIRFQFGFCVLGEAHLSKKDYKIFGLAKSTVSSTINSLIEKNVIIDDICFIINTEYDGWNVPDCIKSNREDYDSLIMKHIKLQAKARKL